MDERRRAGPRMPALKTGRIVFNKRASTIDCTVRNLTARGAKLLVGTQIGIPETFDLDLMADGSSRSCRVVWRKPGQIGVEFD